MWQMHSPPMIPKGKQSRWTAFGLIVLDADDIETAPPIDNGAAADLESRWIGRGVVVHHRPAGPRGRFVARLDSDGRWTCESSGDADASSAAASSIGRAGP